MLIHPSIRIFKRKFHFFISISFEFTSKDVTNYLLAISSFGWHMQDDMDTYITRDRHIITIFCRKLYPITKNLTRGQNPLELVLMLSTFGMQNSLIGSQFREIDIDKKDLAGNIVNKASNLINIEIELKLQALESNANNNGGYITTA